jgi:ribosomal protein S18 acetylase RimI-like enzyme/predicted nucleic acid-binding protein
MTLSETERLHERRGKRYGHNSGQTEGNTMMAKGEPQPRRGEASASVVVQILAVQPHGPALRNVIALANGPAKKTLGFLPDSGFVDRARKGTLLAACSGSAVVGYVLYDLRPRDIKIVHLCVSPDARRGGVARRLIDAVRDRHDDRNRLTLRCRTDYREASRVWESLGFRPVGTIPGRRREGSELTVWLDDTGDIDLFGGIETERDLAALDHNVFLDLHIALAERPQGRASRVLLSDWIGEFVELVVTDEVAHEINRLVDPAGKQSQFEQIGSYRHVGDAKWRELEPVVAAIVPRACDSDHRHVARAAAAGATFLLTRDRELLKQADKLEQAVGVRVIEPAALIVRLDRLQADGPYRLKDLEGTALQTASPSENDHETFLSSLLNNGRGERRGEFRERVSPLLADTKLHETKVVRDHDGTTIAGFTRTARGSALEVPVLRVAPGAPAAAALARQLVFAQRAEAAERRASAVVVTDPHPSRDISNALAAEGFKREGQRWSCAVATGLTPARVLGGVQTSADAARYEHQRWPVRVTEAGVQTYLVPIKVTFAAALIDPGLAEGSIFKRDPILGLMREHVYYRATRNGRGIHAGARILWYVTGTNPVHPRPSIRAVSQVAEVREGNPRHLFSRFERFGVYTEAQVVEAAGADGNVMAVRFVDTETFATPLDLDEIREVWTAAGDEFVAPPSPTVLSERMFASIYARSSSYAV